jgi:hypothetical protein
MPPLTMANILVLVTHGGVKIAQFILLKGKTNGFRPLYLRGILSRYHTIPTLILRLPGLALMPMMAGLPIYTEAMATIIS